MRKQKNYYFAEKEEKAVFDYITSDSKETKAQIYNTILIEPFRKMIQSILRRYPVHIGNYTMEEVEQNALTHLIEHMIKYRPYIIESKEIDVLDSKWAKMGDKYKFLYLDDAKIMFDSLIDDPDNKYRIVNAKAFSYCQTIIRNYFKDHTKKSYNEKKVNLSYDDYVDEINQKIEYHYELQDEGYDQLEQLIQNVVDKIEILLDNSTSLKKNEGVVGEAIVNVLKNWHILFLEDSPEGKYNKRVTNKFAKNKILLFLKEQTGLTTKEIRMAMKPFKEIYFFEKAGFLED